jgi:hypothetical protein
VRASRIASILTSCVAPAFTRSPRRELFPEVVP